MTGDIGAPSAGAGASGGGEPAFLDVDEVIDLHDQQLVRYGGATGLRDRGGLESAVATPQASFGGAFLHRDLFHMAAAYAFHIAENQPLWMATSGPACSRHSCFST